MPKKGLTYSFKPGTSPVVKKAFKASVKAFEKQLGPQAFTKVAPGQGNIVVRQTPPQRLKREKAKPGTVVTSMVSSIPNTAAKARSRKTVLTVNPLLKKQQKKAFKGSIGSLPPNRKPKNITKAVAAHELQHAMGVHHASMGSDIRELTKRGKAKAKQVVYGKKPAKKKGTKKK